MTSAAGGHRHQQHGHGDDQGKSIDEPEADQQGRDGGPGWLPPVKVHCSVLAEQAIKAAVADYYRNQGIDPTPIVGELTECEECACDATEFTPQYRRESFLKALPFFLEKHPFPSGHRRTLVLQWP